MASRDERPDPYQEHAPENEGRIRPQYHHDPSRGETRYPPESGYQHAGVKGDDDPHAPLNTPLSELEEEDDLNRLGAGSTNADVEGMGRAQRGDPGMAPGDPDVGDREPGDVKAPGQTTPFGVTDPEAEAVRRAEDVTGVPLGEREREPGSQDGRSRESTGRRR